MPLMNVPDERLELVFRPMRSKVGSLGLEGAHQISGGIDDGRTEGQDGIRAARQMGGKTLGVGIETHAKQGSALLPGLSEGQ